MEIIKVIKINVNGTMFRHAVAKDLLNIKKKFDSIYMFIVASTEPVK